MPSNQLKYYVNGVILSSKIIHPYQFRQSVFYIVIKRQYNVTVKDIRVRYNLIENNQVNSYYHSIKCLYKINLLNNVDQYSTMVEYHQGGQNIEYKYMKSYAEYPDFNLTAYSAIPNLFSYLKQNFNVENFRKNYSEPYIDKTITVIDDFSTPYQSQAQAQNNINNFIQNL